MKHFLISQWSLVILLIASAVLIILEIVGQLEDKDGTVLLSLLAAFVLYQIVENYRTSESLAALVKREKAASITVLSTAQEFFVSATAVVESARHSIDACYFTPFPPTRFYDDPEIERYWRRFSDLLRQRPTLSVRRMATLDNTDKVEWVKTHVLEHKDCHNYNFAVVPNIDHLPLMNVMIVDNCRTFVFSPHGARARNYILVESGEFARGMLEYYDLMWSAGNLLKDGPNIHLNRIPEQSH